MLPRSGISLILGLRFLEATVTICNRIPYLYVNFFDGIINFPIQVPSPLKVKAERFIPKPLQRRYFHFTKEKLAELKAKANNEMGTDRISSLQAVVGHFWRSMTRSRCLDSDEKFLETT